MQIADGHRGYCLQFLVSLTSPSFFWEAQKVMYRRSFEKVDIHHASKDQIFDACFLAKAWDWRYEQEWRVFGPDRVGNRRFPPEVLVGVVLGARMPERHRQLIEKLCSARAPRPNVSVARISEDKYALE